MDSDTGGDTVLLNNHTKVNDNIMHKVTKVIVNYMYILFQQKLNSM